MSISEYEYTKDGLRTLSQVINYCMERDITLQDARTKVVKAQQDGRKMQPVAEPSDRALSRKIVDELDLLEVAVKNREGLTQQIRRARLGHEGYGTPLYKPPSQMILGRIAESKAIWLPFSDDEDPVETDSRGNPRKLPRLFWSVFELRAIAEGKTICRSKDTDPPTEWSEKVDAVRIWHENSHSYKQVAQTCSLPSDPDSVAFLRKLLYLNGWADDQVRGRLYLNALEIYVNTRTQKGAKGSAPIEEKKGTQKKDRKNRGHHKWTIPTLDLAPVT